MDSTLPEPVDSISLEKRFPFLYCVPLVVRGFRELSHVKDFELFTKLQNRTYIEESSIKLGK